MHWRWKNSQTHSNFSFQFSKQTKPIPFITLQCIDPSPFPKTLEKSNWRLLTFPPLLLTVQSRLKCALKYIVFVVLGSVLYQEYFPKVPKIELDFPRLYSCNRVKKFLELNNLKITSSIFWNFKIASDWPDLVLRYLKSVNFKWSCILII